MYPLYDEVGTLDQRCYEVYHMSEELLMEHAALALQTAIKSYPHVKTILIGCGCGNNGADGLALARLLHAEYQVYVWLPLGTKSPLARLQMQRCEALGINVVSTCVECDLVVDALFGTGYVAQKGSQELIKKLNALHGIKIGCDIPSGLGGDGEVFGADLTVTMGGAKKILFEDFAKNVVGDLHIASLGLPSYSYQTPSLIHVLEKGDYTPPLRKDKSSHKGSYGHLAVYCGEKQGAAWLSAKAALTFGAGLVTLMGDDTLRDEAILLSPTFPENMTALVMGMGLGNTLHEHVKAGLAKNVPMVLDADILHTPLIKEVLAKEKRCVITPHPKEFVSLLAQLNMTTISVEELQKNRFFYATMFGKEFPHITLLLKGANTLIVKGEEIWVNPHGSVALAKGGSGDVLAGMIGALLAQGYTDVEAAIQGSLAHALASQRFAKHPFSLTPHDLIEEIGWV